jgi:hypothetical protein
LKRCQIANSYARKLIELKLAGTVEQVEELSGAEFLQQIGVYYLALSAIAMKEDLIKFFGDRRRAPLDDHNGAA